jgi:mannose-6-phosphate isomerase-like protein (cupin superfamily)
MPSETMTLPDERTAVAPDGSDVRVLLAVRGASVAHFQLAPGETARAVVHRTVDEVWYVLAGRGEMWRRRGDDECCVGMEPGTCLTIPVFTHFQFRATGDEPLQVLGTTSPPWPTDRVEADVVRGPWTPTVAAGPG